MFEFLKDLLGGKKQKPAEAATAPTSGEGEVQKPEEKAKEGQAQTGQGSIDVGVMSDSGLDSEELDKVSKQTNLNNERISDVEVRIQKLESAVSSMKKESDLLKEKMEQNDARILDMLSVYEIVSNQINPFIGSSKVVTGTVEQLQADVEKMKQQISVIGDDIKIIARGRVDLNQLISNTVQSRSEEKRRVDLSRLIQSAIESKKVAKVSVKKGGKMEYGP